MMRNRRSIHSKTSSRVGSAIVETALVMPIFVMIVLGIAEFGRALMVSNLLTNAAREGARLAIVSGVTADEVRTAVAEQVQDTVGVAIPAENITISVTPYTGNPDAGDDPVNASSRDLCNVKILMDYEDIAYVVRFLGGVKLRGQAAMRHE